MQRLLPCSVVVPRKVILVKRVQTNVSLFRTAHVLPPIRRKADCVDGPKMALHSSDFRLIHQMVQATLKLACAIVRCSHLRCLLATPEQYMWVRGRHRRRIHWRLHFVGLHHLQARRVDNFSVLIAGRCDEAEVVRTPLAIINSARVELLAVEHGSSFGVPTANTPVLGCCQHEISSGVPQDPDHVHVESNQFEHWLRAFDPHELVRQAVEIHIRSLPHESGACHGYDAVARRKCYRPDRRLVFPRVQNGSSLSIPQLRRVIGRTRD
mmetsp:Transcript_3889/g.8551  ORF Transcript_3889/g.8551 Transcript_3889/m.8551 type:complete len:267 (-) Transcript_3889:329-1129(-)